MEDDSRSKLTTRARVLPGKVDEDDRVSWPPRKMAKRVGQFQHSAGTRRIVVGSVMHLTNLPGRERMLLTKAKMVVVCSDDNVLVSKGWIDTG